MTAGTGSTVDRAISLAAQRLGIDDPIVMADELLGVDVDGLDQWFSQAARIQVTLFQGAARLSDAVPLLAAGWSNPAPQVAVGNQHDAAMASRQVVGEQVDAAELTGSILRQSRTLADRELSTAPTALAAIGWPPGQDLYSWAMDNGKLDAVTTIVGGLTGRLAELRTRNEQALSDLALALRADPRDSVQAINSTAAVAGAVGTGVVAALTGPADQAVPANHGSGVDQANLDQLEKDLQSSDLATQLMAQGVQAALQKAAANGDVAQLLTYESANSSSQGRAAIGIGDIADADNVAVLAPGVGNAPINMADGIDTARAIRDAAQQRAPGDKTTVVAWYGYDIPLGAIRGAPENPVSLFENVTAAVGDDNAQAGGQRLVADLDQFRKWAPDTARFVAIGFSMGSTTVSAAAARGARLDDTVLVASPGAGNDVDSVADYPQVRENHVFVTSFDNDPITSSVTDLTSTVLANLIHPFPSLPDFTPFGPDPADRDFGGQVIDAKSNNPDVSVSLGGPFGPLADVVANEAIDLVGTHLESNYFQGESLDAVAAVVDGQYSDIRVKPGR